MFRTVLIGLGNVAERIHLPALKQHPVFQVVGACEPDAARRERVAREWSIPNVYATSEELFAAVPADVVVIGSPPQNHEEHCLQSLRAGAHVFCEKPFVEEPAAAERVLAAAEQAKRLVVVNNQYRYMAMYRESGRRLHAGEFGRAFLIQGWQQMFHPPSKETNWRAHLIKSTLFEFGTHALDLMCFLFEDTPEAITVEMPHPRADIAADVVVAVLLRFPGERVATMVLNRISHAPERYFEMRVDAANASLRLSLGGVARASLDWSKALGRPISRVSFVKGGEARVEARGRSKVIAREKQMAFASATGTHLGEFAARLDAGDLDQHALRHQAALIRVVEAGYLSAERGETVRLR